MSDNEWLKAKRAVNAALHTPTNSLAEIARLRDHAAGLALERDGFQEECKRLRADLAAAQEERDNAIVQRAAERLAALTAEKALAAAQEREQRMREALDSIAAWDDHGANRALERDGTYGRFDEPGSVQIARAALGEPQ